MATLDRLAVGLNVILRSCALRYRGEIKGYTKPLFAAVGTFSAAATSGRGSG